MYDICLISFSSLEFDARSLNALKALSKKWRLLCISLTEPSKFEMLGFNKVEHISINLQHKRHIRRWYEFANKIKKLNIPAAKIYWAADLYSLLPCYNSKGTNATILYDSREIYSALGTLNGSKLKQFFLTNIEKYLVKKVDGFIVSGQLDAEHLKKHFRTDKPFSVFLNVPPFKESLKSDKIKNIYPFLSDKRILIYQGAVLEGRGLVPAMNFIAENEEYALVILGDGEFSKQAKEYAYSKGIIDRTVFVGNVAYKELHEWTCSADCGVNLIEPISFSYRLALPNKMFEYISACIPQIVSDLPAMKEIVRQYEIGAIIEDFNSNELIKNALEEIFDNYDFYKQNCQSASKIFNYENEELKIHSLIDSLI